MAIHVAPTALFLCEPGQRVDGGAGVRVRIQADAALVTDAAPLAGEQRMPEQVSPDLHAVEAPFVQFGADQLSLWNGRGVQERVSRTMWVSTGEFADSSAMC